MLLSWARQKGNWHQLQQSSALPFWVARHSPDPRCSMLLLTQIPSCLTSNWKQNPPPASVSLQLMQKYRNTEGNHSCLPAIAQTGLDNSSNRLQDAIPKCLFPTITRLRRFNPVPSTPICPYASSPPSSRSADHANLTQQMMLHAWPH